MRNFPVQSTKPSLSNLPLQILLFYNALFSLIYLFFVGGLAMDKALNLKNITQIIGIIPWVLVEPIRLYYGYIGNMRESVSHLSTFLLMTVFPQMPVCIFLGYLQLSRIPIDPVINSLMFIFLCIEFIIGSITIKIVIRHQTAQFMQLVDHED